MIQVDGNYGEGGGQIVRTALALSTMTQKPFEVSKIRRGRCKSGLKNQHLFCIRALQDLCDAKVDGAELASEDLKYYPSKIKAKTLNIDIGTAGSITLLLQAVLPPCFFANGPVRIKIKGGTDGKWAMPVDYFMEVLLPHLRKFCNKIEFKMLRRGYYPAGQGIVEIMVNPKFKLKDFETFEAFLTHIKQEPHKIDLTEQGKLMQIRGISHASKDLEGANVADRQAKAAEHVLKKLGCPVSIKVEYGDTASTGSGIVLWAVFSRDGKETDIMNPIRIGADSLGERGKRAEKVGSEAAERLVNEIDYKAPVGEYLSDNLIPWLALFGGQIKVSKISNHTLTNIYAVEKFLGKIFEVNEKEKIILCK